MPFKINRSEKQWAQEQTPVGPQTQPQGGGLVYSEQSE